jgi:uncharacterized membrane protein YeaQ/YmgE (transglycosylase-associated protein family)
VGIVWIIIVGFVVGAIARALVPGDDAMPWWQTILLGVAGAFIGNIIAWLIPFGDNDLFNLRGAGWVHSIIGAVVVLLVWRRARAA